MAANEASDTELNPSVGYFFATPVVAAMVPGAEAINADLVPKVRAQREVEAGKRASNRGGWHSAAPIDEWAGDSGRAIVNAGKAMANQMTLDRSGNALAVDWLWRAWANINGPGHANDFHCHPGAMWSSTYYVDDGGCAENPALGGEFEIMDPRGPQVAMHDPSLIIADGGQNSGGTTITFTPRAGLLLMFPGWLQHQVRPYNGSRERISFAFNLSRTD
ncbi:TIGR02466 family protein [Salinisphaera orenii]|uniref:TIGR02466 family protein n=1 Tax=Salinisphaera orenii TaxID=856731 RepID=UPI0013A68068